MKRIILLGIILLAAFLRLYKLSTYPALNADEAAIGYNAYSLLETGRDEHGNSWPIHFKSFNDYKPGLYIYLAMPFVKVLGLNEWSVRLPNALLGTASVFLIYLLVNKLLKSQLFESNQKNGLENVALITSFLLAISPWHLHFSRGGWEANTATFFIMLGIYLFMKFVDNYKKSVLIFSVISFVLSLHTYHSARIVTPLIVFGLLINYQKEIRKSIKPLMISLLLGIILLTPLVRDFTKGEIISRATGVGLFADVGPIEKTNEQRMEHKGTFSIILHNKVVNYGLAFLKNWGAHYHGLFLFISGDVIQRNAVPETGQMYLFEIITVLVGLYFIFKNYKLSNKAINVLIWWLIIAPIPAALTFQSPHALRAQNMIIPLTIISAYGLYELIKTIKSLNYNKFFIGVCYAMFILLISWNFARYLHMYHKHMSKEYPFSSQYGVKELVDYLSTRKKDYKNIIVTNKYDQPYILFLFYTKYPPQKFQKEHFLTPKDKFGFSTVGKYSNYIFKSIDWDKDKLTYPNSLIIGSDTEIPNETNITKRIFGSNDYLYFKIVEN
jgi:4-amino-4-deoxy-L-arabinose transferase-like glycosyltransferase